MTNDFETLLIGGPEEEGEQSSLFIPQSLGLKPLIITEMQRSINPLSDYYAYKKIKKIIQEFKPDIVHTHASKAGAIGRMAAIHCGVPIIVHTFHGHTFHGYFSPFKTRIFKAIERYLSRKSTAIVTISEIQKKELTEKYEVCSKEKTHVIPLGFDLKRFTENVKEKRKDFRKKYNLKEEEIAIGIIGRLAPIKNHFLFIDAFEFVLNSANRKIKALIIGDGETREELTNYIAAKSVTDASKKNLKEKIIFTSWINEVDVALAGLDLVCLTSKNEGTPVSLIEAQAASKFIISTDVGGIRDILHPDCGLLSASEDLANFKANLLLAVNNFEEMNAQAGIASEEVIKKFSYTRLCYDMKILYKKLLNIE